MADRRFHRLFHHRCHALGHAQADVVGDRELRPQFRLQCSKRCRSSLSGGPAESDIGPDRKLCQQASGIFLGGIEVGNQIMVRSQTCDSALDLARGNMFP